MFSIIGMIIIGLIAGALARLLVPGRQNIGILATIVVGVVGSFVGGFLGSLIFHGDLALRTSNNIIGAVIGAVIVLLVYTKVINKSATTRR